mgnify:CR=1 FL=1
MSTLPNLGALSIGSLCPDRKIDKQLGGSCFFFAAVASTCYALEQVLGQIGIAKLKKEKFEFYTFITLAFEYAPLACVKDPMSALPGLATMYSNFLYAEYSSGIILDAGLQGATRRIEAGITPNYRKGVTGTMLLADLRQRLTQEYKDVWAKELRVVGEEPRESSRYDHLTTNYSKGGISDLMALSILLESEVPVVFYSDVAPVDTEEDFRHLDREVCAVPPGKRLLVTVPRPFRHKLSSDSTNLENAKGVIDDAVNRTANTYWPNRTLLSGILGIEEVANNDKSVQHTVSIYPCLKVHDYQVCDPSNGMCYDTLKQWGDFRKHQYPETVNIKLKGVMLFWESGEPRSPDA